MRESRTVEFKTKMAAMWILLVALGLRAAAAGTEAYDESVRPGGALARSRRTCALCRRAGWIRRLTLHRLRCMNVAINPDLV